MAGITETKEALTGVFEVAIFMITRFKDGVGVDDAAAIWDKLKNDEDFKKIIADAYEGYGQIPGELTDVGLLEGISLGKHVLDYVPRFIEAFKKDA